MKHKEKIIYCAGIVDGEGYIAIKKTKYARHCPSPTYHERIQIRMTDEGVIVFFKELFGGNYYKEKPNCKNGKPLYCYQASDLIAYNICKIILPYLIIKKDNAKRIIKLRKSKENIKREQRGGNRGGRSKGKGFSMAKEILDYREKLYQECKRKK
ncbi:hypothetical protein ES705_31924 [subsurface metagenome]|jgi:hypothetical protein